MRKFKYLPEVNDFETEGFVKASCNASTLNRLRAQYGEYFRIFHAGSNYSAGRSRVKYGPYEIFGSKIHYYYDVRKESEFVNFLTNMFYEKNPDPDGDIRKAFTRTLHVHKLHWFGCRHEGKDRNDTRLM